MRLTQLRYFIEVAEAGGVNAAARKLHISQPTITTAIHDLEAELETALFHRMKQRMELTEEGRFFYSQILQPMAALQRAAEDTKTISRGKNGVRLGAPPMIGRFLVPPILSEFKRSYPDAELKIIEAGTDELKRMMVEDQVDMVLMIGESQYNIGFEQYALMHTQYAFYVGKQHPLARRYLREEGFAPLCLQELACEPLVLFDKGLYLNQLIEQAFANEGLTPDVVLSTSQISMIKELTAQAVASTFLMRECVEEKDAMVEIPTELSPEITIVAAWKKGQALRPAALRLLKFMQAMGRHERNRRREIAGAEEQNI